MNQPLPAMVTNPSDFITKQDVKESISKQQALLKASAKFRSALLILANSASDFAGVLMDAGRGRAFGLAAGAVERSGAVRRCGELHDGFGRRLKELADRISKEFEDPMIRCMETHSQNFTNIERKLVKTTKDLQDQIKRAENEQRKKRSSPDEVENARRTASALTVEFRNLKYVHQANVFAEAVRHYMTFHNQCSNIARVQSSILGTQTELANILYESLGVFPVAEVKAGKPTVSASKTAGLPVGGTIPRSTQATQSTAVRRSSLDSLADEFHRNEKQHQIALTGGDLLSSYGAGGRSSSAHGHRPSVQNTTTSTSNKIDTSSKIDLSQKALPPVAVAREEETLPSKPNSNSLPRPAISNRGASSAQSGEKRKVHFTSTSAPLVHVNNDDSVVDGDLESDGDEAITLDVQPSLTAALSTLYPHLFTGEQSKSSDMVIHDSQKTVQISGGADIPAQQLLENAQTTVVVKQQTTQVRIPKVYFPPQADVQSQMGSVVGDLDPEELQVLLGNTSASEIKEHQANGNVVDMVIAVHDFAARSAKEMSLVKGDVVTVRKRQGTWIYGTKIKSGQASADDKDDRYRRGPPQSTINVGWIPVAFVTKYVTS